LLHLPNSDDGRDLMKEVHGQLRPAGGFMLTTRALPACRYPNLHELNARVPLTLGK